MLHLLYIGSVQALFLLTKQGRGLSDRVLAAWMVFIALPLVVGALMQSWPGIQSPILLDKLIYPLTYGPFMWLYVNSLTGDIGRITGRDLVHFLPFAGVSLFQLASGWAPVPPHPDMASFDPATRLVGAANLLVFLAYAIAVFWRLTRHGRAVRAYFSTLPTTITLGWLRWTTVWIFAVFLLLFLAAFLSMPALLGVHLAGLVLSILWLSFFGLRQHQVFEAPETLPESQAETQPDSPTDPAPGPAVSCGGVDGADPRYERSGLSDARAETIARRLEQVMKSERPYLEADLTIEALARRIAVPRHHLTEVINKKHRKNFYHFVNGYRIDAVKRALRDPACADQTLLEIALASGFNSKSPFNTAFRQLTGVTPSQYRRNLA